jgi:hypothetical protein
VSIRIDQEAELLLVEQLTSGNSNVRINQESLLVLSPELTTSRTHVRINQEALLLLVNIKTTNNQVQLTGGNFMDAAGNPVAYGTLIMELSNDAKLIGSGKVVHAIPLNISLDTHGNVAGTQTVFPTDMMTPTTTTYTCWVKTNSGAQVWGPHVETVSSGGAQFNLTQNWVTST